MLRNIQTFLEKRGRVQILFIFSVIFFILYSILVLYSPNQFNSPDEQANYFFIQHYLTHKSLTYNEPLNATAFNLIRPRSTGVIGTNIVPGSFLGLILFISFIGLIFGKGIILFAIPLLSAITPLFLYIVLKRIFEKNIAFIAALLLFIHPAFWYYSTRFLFPNILLVDLLIIGFACYFIEYKRHELRLLGYFIGSVCIGYAAGVRLNELLWIGILLVIVGLYNRHVLRWSQVLVILFGGILGLAPSMYYNVMIYGHPLFTGYFEVNTLIKEAGHSAHTLWSLLQITVLPFGFKLKNILKNTIHYQVYVFSVLVPFILLGIGLYVKDWRLVHRKKKWYLYTSIIVSAILLIYYGSWKFNDHPDPRAISIGTSYIRYWLPIYILSLPFIAYSINGISRFIQRITRQGTFFYVVLLSSMYLFLSIYSANLVLTRTDESILHVIHNIKKGVADADVVIANTEDNAVVIVDYDDKFIFPRRRVMIPFRNEYIQNSLPDIIKQVPVYYWGLKLPQKDLDYLNDKKFSERNLYIEEYMQIENKSLYKIYDKEN